MDLAVNFAKSALASGITAGAGSLTLVTGGGARFAGVPWNGVIYNSTDYSDPSDDPAVEIVRCTLISTDTLTITRGQESTTGVAHNTAGKTYTLVAGPTSKLLTDIYSLGLKGGRQYWKSTQSIGMQPTGVAFGATLPVLGGGSGRTSFTDGQIVFPLTSGAQTLTGSANLFWDNTNNRLGIGKTNPATAVDVSGTVTATAFTGLLTTAAQTAITSVGTLSGLTVAGQIETTSTGVKFPDATVQSTAYASTGILRTLKETVFAGITPASYSTGTTTTIDGSGYTCTLSGNGTVNIVTAGLQIRKGTTGTTGETDFNIIAGNTGDFKSIVGEARFRRGQWALWSRIASYAYTNASGNVYGGINAVIAYPQWGVSLRRAKNIDGSPNTATGGIAASYWWAGTEPGTSTYPGVSTDDVWMAYFRTPEIIDLYHGAYSSGWPTMEAMTLYGTIQMQAAQFVGTAGSPIAASVAILFNLGGSAATSGTYEIVFDRWRITTWE